MLPESALVARCLCKDHNSDLSPLDTEAARLFVALQSCDASEPAGDRHYIGSGHDLERWLLKTLAAMAYSRNFAHPGGRLEPTFFPSLDIPRLIENPGSWPLGAGLYAAARVGQGFARRDEISIAPIFREQNEEIVGLYVELQGFRFDFFPTAPAVLGINIDTAGYRLGRIEVLNGEARHVLSFSWDDLHHHGSLKIAAVPVSPN